MKINVCGYCIKQFTRLDNCKRHSKELHREWKPLCLKEFTKCPHCLEDSRNKKEFMDHLWKCAKNPFYDKRYQRRYQRYYGCSECKFSARYQIDIILHIKRSHNDYGYVIYNPQPDLEYNVHALIKECAEQKKKVQMLIKERIKDKKKIQMLIKEKITIDLQSKSSK